MGKMIVIICLLMAVNGTNMYVKDKAQLHPAEPELVFVEGGTFRMGCTSEQGADCRDNEKPQHSVTVSGFHIGKYEVTQEQWIALMGRNPSGYKNNKYPVDNVSWDDVQEFIRRLNAATNKNYRLPTEAEWEYAARGGVKSKGYMYSGSNIITRGGGYYSDARQCRVSFRSNSHSVNRFRGHGFRLILPSP